MESCAPFDPTQGYASALTRYVDCQAALLGEGGYAALSAANSPVILALGGLLTILVALQGYRLLLGEALAPRDAVLLAAKVGLVLTFATQWPAYRATVYNLSIETPRELLSILPGAGGGSGRNIPARLQTSYQAIAELTRPSAAPQMLPPPGTQPNGASEPVVPQTLPFSLTNNPLLASAGIVLLVSGLAVLLTVRLLAALLLALGPLFFACLLFDTTRGLFEGWLRALLGMAIASLSTGLLLGLEMAVIEPQLTSLVAAMAAGTLPVLAPGEILVTTLIFALALIVALLLSLRIGGGFRFVGRGLAQGARLIQQGLDRSLTRTAEVQAAPREAPSEIRPRAVMISQAISQIEQRGSGSLTIPGAMEAGRRIEPTDRATVEPRPIPLGQTYRRSGKRRMTRSISQRNGRT